jgi:hypothetical protein
MCNFFSCIVTQTGSVYHNAAIDDSHTSIELPDGLRDDTANKDEMQFCKVEIVPPDGNVFAPLDQWSFDVDESITPTWWNEEYRAFAYDALKEFLADHAFNQGKYECEIGRYWASGSATVEAWGSATVEASGSATVEASGSATVEASGSATVKAWGSATVRAWGSATVKAWGSATVDAWGSATVEAAGSATVEASGSATVKAWGSATVEAWGSATVKAWDSATVEASGSATVKAWDSATVRASGSATVKAWGSATVDLDGDAICIKSLVLYINKSSSLRVKRSRNVT